MTIKTNGTKVTTGVRATTRPRSTQDTGDNLKAALARKKAATAATADQEPAPLTREELKKEVMDTRTLQRITKRLAYLKRNRPATGAAEIRDLMAAIDRHRSNLHRSYMI